MPDTRGVPIFPGDRVTYFGSRYIGYATVLRQVAMDRYLIQLEEGTETFGPFDHPDPAARAEMDQADATIRDHVEELLGGDDVEPRDPLAPFEVPGRLLLSHPIDDR